MFVQLSIWKGLASMVGWKLSLRVGVLHTMESKMDLEFGDFTGRREEEVS